MKSFSISEEKKKQFAGIYVLEYMINKPQQFSIMLSGDDQDLEPILEWLLVKDYVEIRANEDYVATEKGRTSLSKFMERYSDCLNVFDLFCAVDLEAGEFAFSYYSEFDNEEEWRQFLSENRWDDLRIAVADYKKLDPVEIVFMSFINEGRFGRNQIGWQFDLLLGSVWDEILEICNTAIRWQNLGFEDDDGGVSAKAVIEDIIIQGAEIMIDLHKNEEDLTPNYFNDYNGQGSVSANGEIVGKVRIENQPPEYYSSYLDPRFVSPIWSSNWMI